MICCDITELYNIDRGEVDDLNNGIFKGQVGLLYEEGQCDRG